MKKHSLWARQIQNCKGVKVSSSAFKHPNSADQLFPVPQWCSPQLILYISDSPQGSHFQPYHKVSSQHNRRTTLQLSLILSIPRCPRSRQFPLNFPTLARNGFEVCTCAVSSRLFEGSRPISQPNFPKMGRCMSWMWLASFLHWSAADAAAAEPLPHSRSFRHYFLLLRGKFLFAIDSPD